RRRHAHLEPGREAVGPERRRAPHGGPGRRLRQRGRHVVHGPGRRARARAHGPVGDGLRPFDRRARARRRELPRGRRVEAVHGARAVTARLVAWSPRNRLFVLLVTGIAVAFAIEALRNIPLDAIPDLSDTQVIIYSRWDRSPDILEDQVTYPIVSSLVGAPRVKAVRGVSD